MFSKLLSSILFFIAWLISLLPIRLLYVKSTILSYFLKNIIGYRKAVIVQNLSRAFPEAKYKEIGLLTRKFYLHFTDIFIETLKGVSISRKALSSRLKVENPEVLTDLHKKGYNVIGLMGHMANWEWLSILPSYYDFPVYTLYKPLRSKTAEHIINKIRCRFGMNLLSMSAAPRYILNPAHKNSFYIFIADQSPARVENAYEYTFLNQRTTFFTGGAKLAIATKSALLFISLRKVERGYYSLRFIPIDCESGLSGDSDKRQLEQRILKEYARLLETEIKENPTDWLWSHKRWKHP